MLSHVNEVDIRSRAQIQGVTSLILLVVSDNIKSSECPISAEREERKREERALLLISKLPFFCSKKNKWS
jgi:hypothetical protein